MTPFEICQMMSLDCADDALNLDTTAFDAANIGRILGEHLAMISVLADVLGNHISSTTKETTQ